MQLSLEGKTALVCGSTQGIGNGIAKEFAKAGASVIVTGRSQHQLQSTIEKLENPGHDYILLDQSESKSIQAAAEQIKNRNIDIIVNNTGGPDPGLISEENWSNFELAITKQLRCSQQLTMASLPGMKSKNWGRIINIISTSVKIPIYGLGVSNTLRGAMASWAKTLSLEVGKYGITVNSILPGFIQTNRLNQIVESRAKKAQVSKEEVIQGLVDSVPTGRIGNITDISSLALFLSSDQASYINGVTIPVDGGRTGTI